ncbi:uncharacterized protein SPPG_03122 [Spizellomyces punctatus DAOM BR117]|uniref:FHA domain-containing protein n=1 Tax=Spizellomyces punctatus (strain DAOM BR117) TaxID=645134 RepID=A0A0L0HJL3_SPIPD|nr:uncharacterized protein SPPG_03122 [Spizellomyces punctatus DAOM BR117]KND01312.1 hypothetical protein SPPG_03122 [Spizellomyces punctatus DAOM BR117]|eukprot:XP_016609351.1 hypothetical protein SPPG_03122 [Spizellomyces punctatus DAOM BR117]
MSSPKFAVPGLPASKVTAEAGISSVHETAIESENATKEEATDDFVNPGLPASKLTENSTENARVQKKGEAAPQTIERAPQSRPEAPPLNYEPPEWSAAPKEERYFEVLKGGQIIHRTPSISKPMLVVGRLPICDIELEHASISRYHAVIQFKGDGTAYVYDLGSTHGTFLNKSELPKGSYQRLRVGDMLRFGASTRIYIFQGEGEQVEEIKRAPVPRKQLAQAESTGVTWGFGEDASEEDQPVEYDLPENDNTAVDENAYYYADPRKALRLWLEARGYDMEFRVEEEGHGRDRGYVARIELPVEVGYGAALQGVGHGRRKKEAENDAALDACIKLDKRGVLRSNRAEQAEAERNRMKALLGDEDESEDSFYDRTKRTGKSKTLPKKSAPAKAETYESLLKKRDAVLADIADIQRQVEADAESKADGDADQDELDQVMLALHSKEASQAKETLKRKIPPLQKEVERLNKLIKLVAPTSISLPAPPPAATQSTQPADAKRTKPLPGPSPISQPPAVQQMPPSSQEHKTTDDDEDIPSPKYGLVIPQPPLTGNGKRKEPDSTSNGKPERDPTKRRRVYGVLTQAQVEEHEQVEKEEAVDWIAPGGNVTDADVAKSNAAYGY